LPWHLRLARWALLPQHRNAAFGSWARTAADDARGREFDVVHAHDYTALEAGDLLATERGVPLVYDTHELWAGRPREYRPTPLQDRHERRTERRIGLRAAVVITVGDGVADALRSRYGWQHVVVVRNTFPDPGPDAPAAVSPPAAVVYAGRIAAYRDLETVAAAHLPLPVTLIGPADGTWLGEHASDLVGCEVREPVDVAAVTELLRSAGISLVTSSDVWDNHLLAQPNKLFHAVHAGVPVVATDVPEVRRVVLEHGLGTVYRAGDAADLARAVAEVVDAHAEYVARVVTARAHLSWAADSERLITLYEGLARPVSG
jgi:glycosyltransferase involved in cell wall biosynthesis